MAPRYDDENAELILSAGDLIVMETSASYRPTLPAERARGGQSAHRSHSDRQAQSRANYHSEEPIELEFELDGCTVIVRGRLDGIWQEGDTTVIEEVKSTLLDRGLPRSYHIAQLRVYLWMMHQAGRTPVDGQLTYAFPDGSTKSFPITLDDSLAESIHSRLASLLAFQRAEAIRLKQRAEHHGMIHWPFDEWRGGQRQMYDMTENAVRDGMTLLLEAPTGVGKTAPIVIAAMQQTCRTGSQLMIATSRTAQQSDRIQLVESCSTKEARGRVLLLGSRQKLGDSFADGPANLEGDSLDPFLPPEWVMEFIDRGETITPERTRQAAEQHSVSAARLQRLLARHADVIIGDQNFLANVDSAYVSPESSRPRVLLLDEAHGLPDRQREREAAHINLSALRQLFKSLHAEGEDVGASVIEELGVRLKKLLTPVNDEDDAPRLEPFDPREAALFELAALASAHVGALASTRNELALSEAAGHLKRLSIQTESAFDYLDREEGGWHRERLDCGLRLADLWARLDAAVVFSGTLKPFAHFRSELGLPAERTRELLIPDLADRHQRLVLRHAGISTVYKRREAGATGLASLLADMAKTTGGRWLVFFPSRAYLELLEPLIKSQSVQVAALRAGMPAKLLERMGENLTGPSLLLALMGGTASEGIDLPGDNFNGCAVVSPAVAPASPRSELLGGLYESRNQDGRLFASVLPGLIRVRQAAGRLWRGPDHRAALVLIGERYGDPDLEELLPDSWSMNEPLVESADLIAQLEQWWNK